MKNWEPVRVRFLEGGRAQQTPAAVCLGGEWRDVRLLSGALQAGLSPTAFYERIFLVQTLEGTTYLLRGRPEGTWQIRTFYRGLGARSQGC